MLIFHTSDWHLGNVFHRHDRIEEHQHFFAWLLTQLRTYKPDAMIVSGDIFDNTNPSAAAERIYYEFLQQAVECVEGLQIVIIAGNHDSAHRLEAPSPFLKRNNIYVRGNIKNLDTQTPDFEHYLLPLSLRSNPEAKVVCMALPYLRACDYPASMSITEGLKYYFDKMTRALNQSPFKKLPVVGAAHFYASGVDIADEHSERLVVGGQDVVEMKHLENHFAYMALGHIHRRQAVAKNSKKGGEIYYSGSVLPMSFSEKHYQHGIIMVNIDEEANVSVEPLDYQPMKKLISIPERGAATTEEVLRAIAELPNRTASADTAHWPYLELRVMEQQPEPTFLNDVMQVLKDKAVHFCRIVRETPRITHISDSAACNDSEKVDLRLKPEELAKHVYKQKYETEMPQEMLERLSRCM
ncbi:MAG: exonuclease SbcCD subunit D [Bacteroidaceae bacterium]|nr:exonuclease SbcCD subunit D [Bacteroidaceae bacterium]